MRDLLTLQEVHALLDASPDGTSGNRLERRSGEGRMDRHALRVTYHAMLTEELPVPDKPAGFPIGHAEGSRPLGTRACGRVRCCRIPEVVGKVEELVLGRAKYVRTKPALRAGGAGQPASAQ